MAKVRACKCCFFLRQLSLSSYVFECVFVYVEDSNMGTLGTRAREPRLNWMTLLHLTKLCTMHNVVTGSYVDAE